MTIQSFASIAVRPHRSVGRTAAVAALFAITIACAADFPVKPIRIITPFPPGGSVDLVARLLAADLTRTWGQQVVVDSHAGASGNIGTELGKRAAADGYTLLLNTLPFITNQFVYTTMPYDPLVDFVPITVGAPVTAVLVVHPSLPVRTAAELIALAKSKPPGAINYASSGPATNPHIAGELVNYIGQISLAAIQYKGGGPAMAATISGETQVFVAPSITYAMPQVAARRLRALGVSSLQRSPMVPHLPTLSESGLPGYEFVTWHVFAAPVGTPRAIINQLNEAVRAAVVMPEGAQRWRERGIEVFTRTSDESLAYLKAEVGKWRVIFKERGIKAE